MVDAAASYIRMVQHLIERCLIVHMSREECMEALSQHANIKPVITSTVWKELEKENKEFFAAYAREMMDRASHAQLGTMQRSIEKMLSGGSTSSDDSEG